MRIVTHIHVLWFKISSKTRFQWKKLINKERKKTHLNKVKEPNSYKILNEKNLYQNNGINKEESRNQLREKQKIGISKSSVNIFEVWVMYFKRENKPSL